MRKKFPAHINLKNSIEIKKNCCEKKNGDSLTKTQHAAITAHTYPIEEYGIVLTKKWHDSM